MKGQKLCKAYLFATVFCVFYLLHPTANACMANPTNYWQFSKAVPVDQAVVVPIVDERAPVVESSDAAKPKVLALVIAFAIAVAVIGYIIYQIIKLLDKVIPPPDKKPDPPPNSGNTNYPPVVVNPNGSPGPAITDLHPHRMLLDTNMPSWGKVPYYDIGWCKYPNTTEQFSVMQVYDGYWSVGMTTSTNLVDWEDSHYRIDAYVCSGGGSVYYRYFHYGTNYYNAYYSSGYIATNHVAPAYFDLTDRPYKEKQFFRLAPRTL